MSRVDLPVSANLDRFPVSYNSVEQPCVSIDGEEIDVEIDNSVDLEDAWPDSFYATLYVRVVDGLADRFLAWLGHVNRGW